jgi:hypothetical protein
VRTLADRMIDALTAGHLLGGDGRHGETQSAAVVVADPRQGRSRRPDKITVNINVCEHPEPLGELRRIYNTATETLGFRRLEQFMGRDVLQLKLMLHALGYYRANEKALALTGPDAAVDTEEAVKALDAFRAAQQWGTTVPGFVDARVIERLWSRLKEKGLDDTIRRQLLELQTCAVAGSARPPALPAHPARETPGRRRTLGLTVCERVHKIIPWVRARCRRPVPAACAGWLRSSLIAACGSS